MNGLPVSGRRGFTLTELMAAIVILAVLAAVAYPSYQTYIRKARLEEAHAALLENSRYLERFYAQRRTFKASSTAWPPLPRSQTDHFCIKFQGNARGVEGDKYTLKAVAFDTGSEPRVLLINQDQSVRICGRSNSRCDSRPTFSGSSGTDRECSVYR